MEYFLKNLISKNLSVALWYIYTYIGLMTMLPLLRRLAQNMNAREYVYMAGMSILCVGVIPILQYRLTQDNIIVNGSLKGALFATTSIVYFLMGYFFENVLEDRYWNWKNALIGIILSIISIGICCYMTDYRILVTGECSESVSQAFHGSLIAIPTYTIYFCIRLIFMKCSIPDKVQKMIRVIGGTTFGVYLFERILRNQTIFIYNYLNPIVGSLSACLIYILCAVALGVIIILGLKKIPGIRYFI